MKLTCVYASIIWLSLTAPAQAAGPISQVTCNPQSTSVEGNMPYTTSFTLGVTSPATFPIGVTSNISFNTVPTLLPAGMTAAMAASFVTVTPATGQPAAFTGPNQTISYVVTLNLPLVMPPAGSVSVQYSYQLKTAGWPAAIAGLYSDIGGTINATATLPPPNPQAAPTVIISTPIPGTNVTYAVSAFPATIPLLFDVRATMSNPIKSMDASLSGPNFVGNPLLVAPAGLETATAVGTASLLISAPGTYTVQARGSNAAGTGMSSSQFVVQSSGADSRTIVISDPDSDEAYIHEMGTPALNLPFSFIGSTTNSTIATVSAMLDNTSAIPITSSGLGTTVVNGTGTMQAVAAGPHILTVVGVSGATSFSASVAFSVADVPRPLPPTVAISAPTVGSSYLMAESGPALSIPLVFTAASHVDGVSISSLTAELNGTPLVVNVSGIGQPTATGTAQLIISAGGSYTINVAATDRIGAASSSRTFSVSVPITASKSIGGTIFFDANFDGIRGANEPGLPGMPVSLRDPMGGMVASTTTSGSGSYVFSDVAAGSYVVVPGGVAGLSATTLTENTVSVALSSVTIPNVGFGLKCADLRLLKADGFSHGFWKNNLEKALANKTQGVQVAGTILQAYTTAIRGLALEPYASLDLKGAAQILSSTSSNPADLLSKQLLASEYNFASGAYIGGNKTLTACFILWGEWVLKNRDTYSAAYLNFAQKWFDAYNNSHGSQMLGPSP